MGYLQKMAKARATAIFKAPYFSSGIHSLIPKPVCNTPPNAPISVTEGMVLYFNPDYVQSISDDELADILLHEVMHIYDRTHERADRLGVKTDEEQERFNIASDLAINGLMALMEIRFKDGVYPQQFGFPSLLTTEEYYKRLTDKTDNKNPNGASGDKGDQKGKGKGKGKKKTPSENNNGNGGSQSDQSNPADPNSTPNRGVANGACGGIAGNPANQEFEKALDAEMGRTPSEQNLIHKQMQNEFKSAAGRGTMPGKFAQHLDFETDKSKIPWQTLLRNLVQKCIGQIEGGGDDFSMMFPSKRSHLRGILRPGMIQHKINPVFILDTSGSMSTKDIGKAVAEIIAIIRGIGCEHVWLIQADMDVSCPPQKVCLSDLSGELTIHGRGGTDFDAALRKAERVRPKPDIVFYLTDGDGGVSYVPKIPVVWVVIANRYYQRNPMPFGKTVVVD